MGSRRVHVVVLSTLFPGPNQPQAGLFIRERMFRVAAFLPVTVVSPVPWFPFQSSIRWRRPNYRPQAPRREVQSGIEILRPRFLSVPGMFRRFDGIFLALCTFTTFLSLKRAGRLDVLDAHFAYPDGYAATWLARWLEVPVCVTLRGKEARQAAIPALRRRVAAAVRQANRVFAVSGALKQLAVSLGISEEKVRVIGNGVDLVKFTPLPKNDARSRLGLPQGTPVLISVGGLVERKGFHRVLECLPALLKDFPGLQYLVVGGASPEGDLRDQLERQVRSLGLEANVRFLGPMDPQDLRIPLSAADVFVLATRYEGWANVFLEAMACGLPVVTTNVGGNAEVICRRELGTVVPFGDEGALHEAISSALTRKWDRDAIVAHARANSWENRIAILVTELQALQRTNNEDLTVSVRRSP